MLTSGTQPLRFPSLPYQEGIEPTTCKYTLQYHIIILYYYVHNMRKPRCVVAVLNIYICIFLYSPLVIADLNNVLVVNKQSSQARVFFFKNT